MQLFKDIYNTAILLFWERVLTPNFSEKIFKYVKVKKHKNQSKNIKDKISRQTSKIYLNTHNIVFTFLYIFIII